MLVDVGTLVKEPMSGSGQARAELPRSALLEQLLHKL
jgi:hypothetical protein